MEPVINIDLQMKRKTNKSFIEKADNCRKKLKERWVKPVAIVDLVDESEDFPKAVQKDSIENLPDYFLGKGDRIRLDFGDHQVGYLTIRFESVGSPQDSPLYFRLKFAEVPKELTEKSEEYKGWLSRGWIQEELLHIDVLPAEITLPRRYAFRYLEIEIIDTSLKWKAVIKSVSCKAVSAVSADEAKPLLTGDTLVDRIDLISRRTLQNCMQSVFEDGPKRDRRLWLGDLRLQALTDYVTFHDIDLVKRCLYLFGGLTRDDGRVGACIFTEPEYIVDDTYFFDYSLLFVSALWDYYGETGDRETLSDLWPVGKRQIELAADEFDERGVLSRDAQSQCFIDWREGLDKTASGQAVYIYCAKDAGKIAKALGDEESALWIDDEIRSKSAAALRYMWEESEGLFVSGPARQISFASQVWMILAGVAAPECGRRIFRKLATENRAMGMLTPYMNHYYAEALINCDMKEEALAFIRYYWGGMAKLGADTFWEIYNPENLSESPYGSGMVNSYCHAWSSTPAYLLRKLGM